MPTQQLVVRVPDDMAEDIRNLAEQSGRRRSDVVRDALQAYLRPSAEAARPASRVGHLLGSLKSGIPNLARDHRRHVLESLARGR